ncbi:MAG TPA: hypothetical protein VG293_03060, partial [Solirubrobacteraceae bacterium]|nr:hypothetical protein [Solirubrobacteraceae bacterium]
MIGSISDVLTRVSAIEQQVQSLQSGTLLDSALGVGNNSSSSSTSSTSTSGFANQLAAASSSDSSGVSADISGTSGASFGSLADSALGAASSSSGSVISGGVSLSSAASGQLTSSQQQFASTLSADTGLNPNVVSAWLLAEESGGAAQSRQAANNNDWLNIGYTDSATFGSSDAVWSDPTAAANATAAWLKGQDSIPGYGTASSG